jgi:hypothetical protein
MGKMGFSRRNFLSAGGAAMLAGRVAVGQNADARPDREQWIDWVEKVSEPVLEALSKRELRRRMPVEAVKGHEADRAVGSQLEAFGRLFCGIAPWLELEASAGEPARETALRTKFRGWAQEGIASAVDPKSPDYMRFGESSQTVVDASFLCLAMLRAPKQMLGSMTATTKAQLVTALEVQRKVLPGFNNWLLFAAMDEVLLRRLGAFWDRMRVDYALREHASWYVGDGIYGDGPHYHADNYNSYVIQPYLQAVMDEVKGEAAAWGEMAGPIRERARRYAAIQERMISPEGTFPVQGRSICYRAGAFHHLADVSLRKMLPEGVEPAQVRGALTAVQKRTLGAAGTFDEKGWLRIGLAGHQPSLGEVYISTGSLYLCSFAWLPLGLAQTDPFWAAPAVDWTQKKVWAGGDLMADHALGA